MLCTFGGQAVFNTDIPTFSCQIWHQDLIKNIDPEDVICFDDEIGLAILKQGKLLVWNAMTNVYYVGMPQTLDDLKKQKIRGISGWIKVSKKYDINLERYYRGIFWHWIKTFYKYSIIDNIAFIYWMILISFFTINAKLNYKKQPNELWEKFVRR